MHLFYFRCGDCNTLRGLLGSDSEWIPAASFERGFGAVADQHDFSTAGGCADTSKGREASCLPQRFHIHISRRDSKKKTIIIAAVEGELQ